MKIRATNFYTTLFVIVLFSQLYLSSFKANIFLQILLLVLFFFIEKVQLSSKFLKTLMPLFLIFSIGFIGFLIHNYKLYNLSKDIFHFIKPILGISIGYLFYKKINNFKLFIKTIVLCGLASALIHFIVLLFFGNAFSGSIESVREYSKDNFLELFALFFNIFYKKYQKEKLFENKLNAQIINLILTISCVLYFSRTMIIVALVIVFSVYKFTYITKKTLKYLGVLLLFFILFYSYLFSIKIGRNTSGLDSFLFKIKNAPAELFKTKIDRENHKDLWDHWRGYEAKRAYDLMLENPSSFIFGTGYGSLVNLKFKAPLAGADSKGLRYISELHNGYIYMFYKTGIFGVILILYFLISLYKKIYVGFNNNQFCKILISAIGIIYLFTTLTITGIYNAKDIIIYILGALLFYYQNNEKKY